MTSNKCIWLFLIQKYIFSLQDAIRIQVMLLDFKINPCCNGILITVSAALITSRYYIKHNNSWKNLTVKLGENPLAGPFIRNVDVVFHPECQPPSKTMVDLAVATVSI